MFDLSPFLLKQEWYTKNVLELSEYAPSLHKDILEVICFHFLKIDVHVGYFPFSTIFHATYYKRQICQLN